MDRPDLTWLTDWITDRLTDRPGNIDGLSLDSVPIRLADGRSGDHLKKEKYNSVSDHFDKDPNSDFSKKDAQNIPTLNVKLFVILTTTKLFEHKQKYYILLCFFLFWFLWACFSHDFLLSLSFLKSSFKFPKLFK